MTATMTIPDSDLARGADALAVRVEPPYLVQHSRRTFHLAGHLLALGDRRFDVELLYVASMLHDLALGTGLDDGVTPFHLRGAGLAASEVLRQGASDEVASLVYDAVALHIELGTAQDPRPEVAGVHLGAAADVIGLRLDQVPKAVLDAILSAHPRQGMKTAFAEAIAAETRRKPYSPFSVLVRARHFLALIEAAPFDE